MIGNLRSADRFVCVVEKCVVEKPVNLKCGLRVECVGNRHDNSYEVNNNIFYLLLLQCYSVTVLL